MSPMERLGLAFCRLENLCWDEAVGEKPKGFDEAKDSVKRALAYTLAAGTAGAVLLLVVLIVAMKDKEERERNA